MKVQYKEVTPDKPHTLPKLILGNLYLNHSSKLDNKIYICSREDKPGLYSLSNGNLWSNEGFGEDGDYIWEDVTDKFTLVENN